MGNCIVVVQFDLPKRSEDDAIKGGTSTAPIYRDLGKKGLIRKEYLNGDAGTPSKRGWRPSIDDPCPEDGTDLAR